MKIWCSLVVFPLYFVGGLSVSADIWVRSLTNMTELDAFVHAGWDHGFVPVHPPGTPYTVDSGLVAIGEDIQTNIVSNFVASVSYGFTVYRASAVERDDAGPRVRDLVNETGGVARTLSAPVGYDVQQWCRDEYGYEPTWPPPDTAWYVDRDPSLRTINMLLIAEADATNYVSAVTNALQQASGTNTPAFDFSVPPYAIELVAMEPSNPVRVWFHIPNRVWKIDVFHTDDITTPLEGWTLLSTVRRSQNPDVWEYTGSLDQGFFLCGNASRDFDKDGVPDIREHLIFGTDASQSDSDGDGLSDFSELFGLGTGAMDEDTDGDGLRDAEELELGSDPLLADSDGDGISDMAEFGHLDTNRYVHGVFPGNVARWRAPKHAP